MPQIRLDSIQEMAGAISELYERVDQIEQRSVNIVRGTLKGIRVVRALVDGRAPFVTEDVYLPFVINGLEAAIAANGVSVDVAAGSAYNVERYRQAATVNLAVTNTGAPHTEYVSVTQEARLVIETNPRPAGYLAIADVSVDGAGNVTQVIDRRKLDLQSAKVFTVDDLIWANTVAPSAPSDLQAFVSFHNVQLYWTDPPDNDFSHVEVHRADNVNDRSQATFIGKSTGTRFTDGPLGYGDTVYYWIRAVDRAGNVGPWHPADQFSGVQATLKRVEAPDVQDRAIVESKLEDWAVTTRTVAQNAINDSKISDVSVVKLVSGTVTTLELSVVDESFVISSADQAIRIYDKQDPAVNRLWIGKLGAGLADYGIIIRAPDGSTVLDATGGGAFINGLYVNSLTASKITAGTFSADYVLGGLIYTSLGFPRVGIDQGGIAGWDGSGTIQFRLRTSDGRAEVAGGAVVLDATGIYTANSVGSVVVNGAGIEGKDSLGVLQFKLDSADGKAYAGGGAVVIDQNGIHINGQYLELSDSVGVGGWLWAANEALYLVSYLTGAGDHRGIGIGVGVTPLVSTYDIRLDAPNGHTVVSTETLRPIQLGTWLGNNTEYWAEVHADLFVEHTPVFPPSLSPQGLVKAIRRTPEGGLDKKSLPPELLTKPTYNEVEQSIRYRKAKQLEREMFERGATTEEISRTRLADIDVTPEEVQVVMDSDEVVGVKVGILNLATWETVRSLLEEVEGLRNRVSALERRPDGGMTDV